MPPRATGAVIFPADIARYMKIQDQTYVTPTKVATRAHTSLRSTVNLSDKMLRLKKTPLVSARICEADVPVDGFMGSFLRHPTAPRWRYHHASMRQPF
jgi:hypothetical protein